MLMQDIIVMTGMSSYIPIIGVLEEGIGSHTGQEITMIHDTEPEVTLL